MLLEYLRNDWDGRVDGVGNDENKRLGRGCRDTGRKITDDTRVDLVSCERA